MPNVWMYLKDADPVTAAPLVVRAHTVVTLHSGLGEVQLPHISKHHRGLFIHGNRKLCCSGGKHTGMQWNVLQFQSGPEQLKGDTGVSPGMLFSRLWPHNVFVNNKLMYLMSTELILSNLWEKWEAGLLLTLYICVRSFVIPTVNTSF